MPVCDDPGDRGRHPSAAPTGGRPAPRAEPARPAPAC